jgi:hypothetical protein
MNHLTTTGAILAAYLFLGVVGCTPTLQVALPSEPIEINLNIKIQHEIRIKVDKDLETLFEDESDIF